MTDSSPALEKLLSMSLPERIAAVEDDVSSRRDEYASIAPHDLADALGVQQPERPADGWGFATYAEVQSVEEQADQKGSSEGFLDLLKGKVSVACYNDLGSKFAEIEESQKWDFSFLNKKERKIIEQALAKKDVEQNQSNGMNCIASYTVEGGNGEVLEFEGLIEDDGVCGDLKTPYDEREGRFHDFSNCVIADWER